MRTKITEAQVKSLHAISEKLTKKYPNDWLANISDAHAVMFWLSVISIAFLTTDSMLLVLTPAAVAWVCVDRISNWLWQRIPGNPRWDHPLTDVDAEDQAVVMAIYNDLTTERRECIDFEDIHPFENGEQVCVFMCCFETWAKQDLGKKAFAKAKVKVKFK